MSVKKAALFVLRVIAAVFVIAFMLTIIGIPVGIGLFAFAGWLLMGDKVDTKNGIHVRRETP